MSPSGRKLRPHHPSSSSSSAVNSPFRSAFDVLDIDQDGKISRHDLHSFYTEFCQDDDVNITKNEDVIESMMMAADTNEDGFVEYEEFERVLVMASGGKSAWRSGVMEDVFKVIDKHSDGKLSHEDLKSFMACAGIAVTDQDIEDMIALGGGDQNGGVSFDSFIRILGLDFVS